MGGGEGGAPPLEGFLLFSEWRHCYLIRTPPTDIPHAHLWLWFDSPRSFNYMGCKITANVNWMLWPNRMQNTQYGWAFVISTRLHSYPQTVMVKRWNGYSFQHSTRDIKTGKIMFMIAQMFCFPQFGYLEDYLHLMMWQYKTCGTIFYCLSIYRL